MIRVNVLGGLYVTDNGKAVSGAASQPRRLALLALLVEAGDLGITRDTLLTFLWPEADEERGKRALAQALYALRRDLGSEDVIAGVKDLRLNPELATSDLAEFREALATGKLEAAAELVRGAFVEGFHLPGADTFERWVEGRRAALAHKFADLLEQLAERAREKKDHRAAVGWLRRLAGQDPLNARIAAQLMDSLAAQGDVSGALQHARVYETLVRQELDLPPDREVIALAERLRGGGEPVVSQQSSVDSRQSTVVSQQSSVDSRQSTVVSQQSTVDSRQSPVVSQQSTVDSRQSTVVSQQSQVTGEPAPQPTPIPEAPQLVIHEISDELADIGHTSGWAAMAAIPSTTIPRRSGSRGRWWIAGAALVLVMGLVTGGPPLLHWANRALAGVPAEKAVRVVAVGRITHYGGEGSSKLGQPLADMLATNLARVDGSRVVSSARMYELQGQLGSASDSVRVVIEAARQAGATELIDGSLYETPAGYRLDLRRTDLGTGAVLHAYTMQGADLFALADSGTRHLAGDLGGEMPAGSLSDVSTRSVVAYRHYEEGLRALYQEGEVARAEQSFLAALKEDSTFVMAAFFSGIVSSGDRGRRFEILKHALDMADKASDRDRLIIRATWAFYNSSPSIRAITDTLMVRYPAELEGFLWSAQGAILAGEWTAARSPLHVVISRDSLGFKGKLARCLGCEAMLALSTSYVEADSLPGAIRISRLWTRLQPNAQQPWRVHAMNLAQAGQFDSAYANLHRADSLQPATPDAWRYIAAIKFWQADYTEAEEIARVQRQTGIPAQRTEASWILSIAYRHEGRFREALEAARTYRAERVDLRVNGTAPFTSQLEGQVLFEMGRYREAAALFDSISRIRIPFEDSSLAARNVVWAWTHMATARAAMGDTVGFVRLADSLEVLGRISGMGRDRRLHFYLRGLLAKARGNRSEEIELLRRARLSPNMGYRRIVLELGQALNASHQWNEAVPVLQAGLRGVFEGSCLYATDTELHLELAKAFNGLGQGDSAMRHYQVVARALQKSDPVWVPLRVEAERGLARYIQ